MPELAVPIAERTAPQAESTAPKAPGIRLPNWLNSTFEALIVMVLNIAVLVYLGGANLSPVLGLVVLVCSYVPVPLMFVKRRAPFLVLAVTLACYLVLNSVSQVGAGSLAAIAISLYTVVTMHSRRLSILFTALVICIVAGASLVVFGTENWVIALVPPMLVFGAAAAFGDASRSRKQYTQMLHARAEEAEQARVAEVARARAERREAVTNERLNIARDLHDTIAHQVSVVSLNAGVATANLDADPVVTREALASIRAASRGILSEIGTLVETLRMPEEEHRAPSIGVQSIEALAGELGESGLEVLLDIDESILADATKGRLAKPLELVAYRVVQEALTNALKHGAERRASVRLSRDEHSIVIDVRNPIVPSHPTGMRSATEAKGVTTGAPGERQCEKSNGFGLIGMRERVASVSGDLQASAAGREYHVFARLPIEKVEA